MFIEPFYVASGFAMYLNRRAQLEAWDVEQELRRAFGSPLGQASHGPHCRGRIRTPSRRRGRHRGVRVAAVRRARCWRRARRRRPPPTAQEPAANRGPPSDAEITKALEAVKQDPNSGRSGSTARSRGRTATSRDRSAPRPRPGCRGSGPDPLLVTETHAVRGLADRSWPVPSPAGVYLVASLRRTTRAIACRTTSSRRAMCSAWTSRPESLPDDVGAAARSLWDGGEQRAALALLYRGCCLGWRMVRAPIRPSTTEGDCVRLASAHVAPAGAAYASDLVSVWRDAVYGGLAADTSAVHQLCGAFATALAPVPVRHGDTRPGESA